MLERWKKQLIPLANYFRIYGGWAAVRKSAYLEMALITTFLLIPIWLTQDWWEISISILPSMIGFTLGALALVLCLGGERFQHLLMDAKLSKHSALEDTTAAFVHFMVVQILGLLAALLAKSYHLAHLLEIRLFPWPEWLTAHGFGSSTVFDLGSKLLGFFGFLLLIYSMLTALACSLRVFNLVTMAVKQRDMDKRSQTGPK